MSDHEAGWALRIVSGLLIGAGVAYVVSGDAGAVGLGLIAGLVFILAVAAIVRVR